MLDEPDTEGQLLNRALEPEAVWLAHVQQPWRPDATGVPDGKDRE